MHFDFTISLGNILTIVAILGLGLKLHRVVMMFLLEHDLLIQDYCERHGISLNGLPTRLARKRGHYIADIRGQQRGDQ